MFKDGGPQIRTSIEPSAAANATGLQRISNQ